MKSPRKPDPGPWMRLQRHDRTPLYRQIYERLRAGIVAGTLRPGERLPSARSLASQLVTARGTIDAAYDLLASQGYIVCRGAAGTIVAPTLASVLGPRPRVAHAPTGRKPSSKAAAPPTLGAAQWCEAKPFQLGLPALDAFPRRLWSRLAARRARELPLSAMVYPDHFGYAPLREAIASYLAVGRGISCAAGNIVITAGFQAAIGLIARVLLDPGGQIWVEDPGYHHIRRSLAAAGATLVPVSVDTHGIDVSAGIALAPRARLAMVTPSHQAPLGVALDLPRRLSLLAWADEANAWIIEDDYDGEFRYEGQPLTALHSLDSHARVLYIGTLN